MPYRRDKDWFLICPEEHSHEKATVCYAHHGCRCQWCVSESRARYQERNGNGKWLAAELISEVVHMVSLNQSIYDTLQKMGVNPETAKTTFYKHDRGDLARMLNRQDSSHTTRTGVKAEKRPA